MRKQTPRSESLMRYAVKFPGDSVSEYDNYWRLRVALTKHGVAEKDILFLENRLYAETTCTVLDKWHGNVRVTWNHILYLTLAQFNALVPIWKTLRASEKDTWYETISPMIPLVNGGVAYAKRIGYAGQYIPYTLTPKGKAIIAAWDKSQIPTQNPYIPNF